MNTFFWILAGGYAFAAVCSLGLAATGKTYTPKAKGPAHYVGMFIADAAMCAFILYFGGAL